MRYAIETPRLLLNSKCDQVPDGLANENGLVGTHIMTHSGPGVWATFDEEIRQYKAPPCMAVTEHWNYDDSDKKGDAKRQQALLRDRLRNHQAAVVEKDFAEQ